MVKVLVGDDTESGCVIEVSQEPLKILEGNINALVGLHVEFETRLFRGR